MSKNILRYFFSEDLTDKTTEILLSGGEFHHIARVNRLKVGEFCFLLNGRGLSAQCQVTQVGKQEIGLRVEVTELVPPDPRPQIFLIQAISKGKVFGSIVEKAVELGAEGIVPVYSKRSMVKVGDSEKFCEKYQALGREALKQCHRLWELEVQPPKSIAQLKAIVGGAEGRYLLDPYEGLEVQEVLADSSKKFRKGVQARKKKVFLAVGPEGGFSDEETEQFKQFGFQKIILPANILKAETAAITGLSLFRYGLA